MKPSDLSADRWRRIDSIFAGALDVPASELEEYLDRACGDDVELRSEVEALLAADEQAETVLAGSASAVAGVVLESSVDEGATAGDRVGPFEITREIGRGGMGVVYLAEDTRLGRPVALKMLPPHRGGGGEAARRFEAEARAVSALDHPNVATLYETDVLGTGQRYMVFAYYEGDTLSERIRRGPIPPNEALDILRALAAGLGAAHARGIIHRDVKPSNVLLTEGGGVKLLDFGVATMAGEAVATDASPFGTAAYMSPEQARGEVVDHRSDLWSLGVVLYEMLTGSRPFDGETTSSVIEAILHGEPTALDDGGGPAELGGVVRRLLRKRAEERFASADDLVDEIHLVHARSVAGTNRRRVTAVIAVAILAVLGGTGLGLGLGRRTSAPQTTVRRVAILPLEDLTGDTARAHVASGVHAAMTAELGALGVTEVLSRSSSRRFAGSPLPLPEIADELGVDAIVDGSLTVEGGDVVVTVTLTSLDPERRVWGERYRTPIEAMPEVVRHAARSVAAVIDGADPEPFAPGAEPASDRDPEAYEAYLRGAFNLDRGTLESFQLADRYFREAIRLDPTFAAAYADLAEVRGRAAFFGLTSPLETVPGVVALLGEALAIDSTLALAHARRAAVQLFWDRDLDGAEQSARRALELNPSLAPAHRTLSEVLAARGRHEEALSAVERASELERWSQFAAFRPAVTRYYMRDFEAAAEGAREGIGFFPDFWQGYWLLCLSLVATERVGEALPACEQGVARSSGATMALGALGYARARNGERVEAARIAEQLTLRARAAYVTPSHVAMIHAGLADHERAIVWLERAFEERDLTLIQAANQFYFDPLHEEPRFRSILDRMGVPGPG